MIDTPKRGRGGQRASERPQKNEKAWLALVLSSLPDATIATDARGVVAAMNPAAERLTGFSNADSIGRPHDSVFRLRDCETKAAVDSPVGAVLAGSESLALDERRVLVRKDEAERFVEGLVAPILDAAATTVGVVLTFRDASGRRAAQVRTDKQLAELRETLRLHELFSTMVGHDLRGPLGSILMSAQLILRRGDPDPVATAKRIQHSGHRMGHMVDQLLDFTRIRSNTRMPIRPEPMNLGTRVHRCLEDLEAQYGKRAVVVELAGDLEGEWDPDRLGQVFSTLVGNAIQHGDAKSAVTVRGDGTSPELVVLSVSNQGEIPRDVLETLFDPYERVKKPCSRTEGLGIGLFISREIALCHGGSLTAASTDGRTQMTVRLPRKCAAILPQP